MTENTVELVRDMQASRAAVRQYRRAASLHTRAAAELMATGWFQWAGDLLNYADRLGDAAKAERIGAEK